MTLDSKTVLPIVLGISLCTASAMLLYLLFKKEDDEIQPREEIESSKHFKRDKSVSKDIIPAVIGRGGSKIKEIEERSGAKIKISQVANEENERQLTLRGSQTALEIAENLIDEIVELQKSYETAVIKVPYWAVGKIIGKGGDNIMTITNVSGAKIKVDSAPGGSSPKTITIVGTPVQIKVAKEMIEKKVNEETQRRESDVCRREPRRKTTIKSEEGTGTEHPGTKGSCPQNAPPAGSSGALLEVFVSAVSSPSRFWLQIFGPQVEQLDQLVQSMTEYYSNSENRELHKLADVQVGQIVAAVFRHDGKWYRAKIAEIKPNEFDGRQEVCDVYFVDYGDNEYVAKEELFSLRTDMLQLRFQAVECFLAGVAPISNDSEDSSDPPHWNNTAIERFEDLTEVARWKRLWSRTCTFKERPKADVAMIAGESSTRNSRESSPIPGVKLYDTKEGKDINIGQILIDEGWAVEVHDEEKKSSQPSTPVTLPPANIRPPTFGDLECSRVLGMVVGNREERATSLPHGTVSPLPSPHVEKHPQDNTFFNDDDKLKTLSLVNEMDHPSSSKSPSPKPSTDLSYPKQETNGIHHSNGTVTNGTKSHNGNDFLNAERTAHIEPVSESTLMTKPHPFHVPDPKDELKAKMNRVDSHHGSLEAMGKHTPPQCLVQKDNK